MAFNWTLEVYLSLLSVLLVGIASAMIFRQHLKNPDRALVIMSISYFSLALYLLASGLGYLLLSPQVSMLKNLILVIISISLTMTISQMISGKLLSYQLVVVTFFSSFAIFPYFFPIEESVQPMTFENGAKSLQNVGFNRIIIAVLFLYIIVALLYFTIKIYRHSPLNVRRDATLYFLGNIFLVLAAISFMTGVSTQIPGIVESLISIGILISSIGLIRTPQLLYVLPFDAIRLSIINSDSGVSFYNYYWKKRLDETDNQLFGAAFLAITNFMQESVGEGGLQEVKLENATMIINKSAEASIYFVTIATKSSYVLRKGLEQFSRSFQSIYGDLLSDESNYEIQEYQKADELIPVCFPYIPEKT